MAEDKTAISFDQIIQADRNRRKNEQLANEIFGKNKQSKDAINRNSRPSSRTPSLASRIGVAKTQRSSSSTSIPSQRPKPPSRPSSTAALRERSNRLASALTSDHANITTSHSQSSGLSIKGKAGPFPVLASNFAPGTTAADIQSAIANDSTDSEGHTGLLSCRLTSEHPTVVAELVFSEHTIADRVIRTYNNQRADGRVLRLVHKKPSSVPSSGQPLPSSDEGVQDDEEDIDMMATDNTDAPATSQSQPPTSSSRYDTDREAANKERESSQRGGSVAEPEMQDGSYGFDNGSTRPTVPSGDDRNGLSRRDDEKDRDRERDRDRDRERERERDRRYDDRSYDRRDDRDRERDRERERDRDRERDRRYDNRPPYDRGRGRPSHYGNGAGAGAGMGQNMGPGVGPAPAPGMGPRGGYGGFPGRGGRMYSDEMMRGGRGVRGGYRGGYR